MKAGVPPSGGGMWTEDGNSPHDLDADGTTYQIADAYDQYLIVFSEVHTGDGWVGLRLNGNAQNRYSYYADDGSEQADDNAFILTGQEGVGGHILVDSASDPGIGFGADGANNYGLGIHATLLGSPGGLTTTGTNRSVSPPLSQFTLDGDTFSGNITGTVRVYGRDVDV